MTLVKGSLLLIGMLGFVLGAVWQDVPAPDWPMEPEPTCGEVAMPFDPGFVVRIEDESNDSGFLPATDDLDMAGDPGWGVSSECPSPAPEPLATPEPSSSEPGF